MQTQVQKILILAVLVGVLMGCSRKKDKFLSRNFHALTTEYNTLFNGRQAFEQGRDALIDNYQDNFWAILPVERLENPEFVPLPGDAIDPSFKLSEEKAIKAIQKHSMQINGTERNPQMDEAFMLLGKSRYYDMRFVRALEAFNYILAYYPASNNIAQAKIWKEKTNLRLDNTKIAIERLHKLLEEEKKLDAQDYADASAMLAQGYITENRIDSALVYIEKAAFLTRKNEEKGRYYFIKGQLYDLIDQPQLANANYDKVIALNRKSPRRYMINAYVNKIANFDYETQDQEQLFELLTDLENNRENRPYLDIINYQFAQFYQNVGRQDSAVAYFNKSLASKSADKFLVSRNYLSLGELNFDNSDYLAAGAYYDSTLAFIPEKSREFRDINKKRTNLNDVILYEGISKRNDSILKLVNMSSAERNTYFEEYITQLKEERAKDSVAAAIAEATIANNEFFVADASNQPPAGSTFYFYNPVQIAQGKLDFKSRWGSRPNEDNWRISNKQGAFQEQSTASGSKDLLETSENGLYNVKTYLSKIPSEKPVIDSISTARNFAYYQLGLIYKEKLKEPQLAIQRLETLLNNNPEERLVLPAKYNLYQLYLDQNDAFNRDKFKNDILINYADTRYASIIKNPEKALTQDEDSPEVLYNKLYRMFENQEYETVLLNSDRYIDEFAGDAFVPKFELLKATAIGRYKGFEAYEEALNYVALNYPNQEEGKRAKELIDKALPQLKSDEFVADSKALSFKLLYVFNTSEKDLMKNTEDTLTAYLKEEAPETITASADVYDAATSFLVVHGFKNTVEALFFAEKLKEVEPSTLTREPVLISTDNYRIVQIHKNLEAYKNREVE
ncbi:tetratricopeptide repeat protein [Leeuwenhoekiella sp. MAR_2009_132]|uniref:type IX secretion system periplasmic lipoprotein PorW/SprE n=1 Tax=Leeuwenhoekiella sp. MAR_2009_132 TaxID=1392489 RepID=UPI000A89BB9E|nr:hypothetical protein [Leeuwenhoekiella sp. MAR_2009_132]